MPLVERGPRAFPFGTARTPSRWDPRELPAGLRWGWAELAGRASGRLGRTGRPGDGGVPVLQVGRAAGDGGVPVLQVGRAAGDGGVPVLYWLWPGKDPEFAAVRASSGGGR